MIGLLTYFIHSAQIPPCKTPYLDLSTGYNHETNQAFSFNESDPFWQISYGPSVYAPYPHCARSTGYSAGPSFGNSRAITLYNSPLAGNMLSGINNCNYSDQPFLFERKIEVYTGANNPSMEVHLSIEQIMANYSISSIILSGPGGPFILFSGCISNQSIMLPTTTLFLQSGHYTLQVHVGNDWGMSNTPTSFSFQMKAAIYASSAIFSDNQHYGHHTACSPSYLLPQTPIPVNDCFIPPATQTEVTIDNFQPGMTYTITPTVVPFSSTFMADANTSYTVTVQDAYGCSLETVLQISPCMVNSFMTKILIEGLYQPIGEMLPLKYTLGISSDSNEVDDLTVTIHSSQAPYTTVTSSTGIIQQNGWVLLNFNPIPAGLYFLEVTYKNALSVWSASPVSLSNNTIIDFTQSPWSVLGWTLKEIDSNHYALYSGDINQDHCIDLFDYLLWNTETMNGSTGYLATDLNGDGVVDMFDYLVLKENMELGMSSALSP